VRPTGAAAGGGAAGGAAAGAGSLLVGIIKWVLIGLIGLVGIGLGAGIVGAILIFTGSPSPCTDREFEPSSAASQQLRAAWDQFSDSAAQARAEIVLTEVGVTSRAVEYIDEKDIPLEDVRVHFCADGLGEALGTIKTPGPDIHVLLRGTLDLSGDKPKIDVDTIKAGNFPGFGTTWIINNIIKKGNADVLDMDEHLISLQIQDGSATLTGGP
jgi:hypothetical protein